LCRHLKPRLTPQARAALLAHLKSFTAQEHTNTARTKTRVLTRETLHRLNHRSVLHGHPQRVIQTGTGNIHQRTGTTLGDATRDGVPRLRQTSLCAYHFFELISFITSISNSRSTSNLRSLAFSASSAFRRLTSSVSMLPNFLRHA